MCVLAATHRKLDVDCLHNLNHDDSQKSGAARTAFILVIVGCFCQQVQRQACGNFAAAARRIRAISSTVPSGTHMSFVSLVKYAAVCCPYPPA